MQTIGLRCLQLQTITIIGKCQWSSYINNYQIPSKEYQEIQRINQIEGSSSKHSSEED